MGDKKPKKTSSGNSDAHKAKKLKQDTNREAEKAKAPEKKRDGKK